jgi:hypothetical protein
MAGIEAPRGTRIGERLAAGRTITLRIRPEEGRQKLACWRYF